MKTLKLITLAAFALLFSQCKTTAPTAPTGPAPSLQEMHQLLIATKTKFFQYADTTKGNPWKAIMLTTNWVKAQPNVQSADALDSTYINIILKSGLETTFSFNQVDDSGRSIFKGGGTKAMGSHISVSGSHSKNTIMNKKVLVYSAGNQDFYKKNEIQTTYDIFKNSSAGLDVTLLKDEQCTPAMVDHFQDYGFVIIDTHGSPTSFMTGIVIDIPESNIVGSAESYKQAIVSQQGQTLYDAIISGDYDYWEITNIDNKIPNWQHRDSVDFSVIRISVTTKHLNKLPAMNGTVLMGSMCYSGYENILPHGSTPMKTAIMNKNPISYYAFSYDDGTSASVNAVFAKKMEDSLADALVIDLDSTKTANLQPDHLTEYFDPTITVRNLWFKHFGADDYSYPGCVDSFIDARDGHLYHAICIGKQNWMKENLNYNAPGSRLYNDDPANLKTYGRLYDWATMMQGAAPSSSDPSGVQGVCPKGWHVPSSQEYFDLVAFIANDTSGTEAGNDSIAGGKMKAISSLWSTGTNVGATNASGFSALPGGGYYNALYGGIGALAEFWMSDQDLSNAQFPVSTGSVHIQNSGFQFNNQAKETAVSCRCVKDP